MNIAETLATCATVVVILDYNLAVVEGAYGGL
jgi:hypothetical protein